MLCPSCKNFRPTNNVPCPFCQAPSLLVNNAPSNTNAWGGPVTSNNEQPFASSGSWGGPMVSNTDWNAASGQSAFPQSPWQDSSNATQQLAFPAAQQGGSAFWSQDHAATGNAGQALLPVPYEGQPAPASQGLMVMPNGFPTFNQNTNQLLPALPDNGQDAPVYLAPMYTKPRPLISPYRAISGLLSVLIVVGLLCSGAGYYAQVTGKLTFFQKMMGNYSPPAIVSKQGLLKVPSTDQTLGPAANIINSAIISDSKNTDVKNHIITNEVNQFTVGDTIYLIYNFSAPQPGTITVKWYNGNNLYHPFSIKVTDITKSYVEFSSLSYGQATTGRVEIYWNEQLARTLFFVVEPAA
ncbi:MAG: hypothetical protein ABI234_04490 [Ktedonobacteraceae bacterium]